MQKLKILLVALLLPTCSMAACPEVTGKWSVNLSPTGSVSKKQEILFSGMRLVMTADGAQSTLESGVGTEWPVTQGDPITVRTLDKADAAVTVTKACQLRIQFKTKQTRAYSTSKPQEQNVAISMNAKGKYLPLIRGFAGTAQVTEGGKKMKHTFTMTALEQ